MRTHSIFMSAIWSTAISPVYAPQPCVAGRRARYNSDRALLARARAAHALRGVLGSATTRTLKLQFCGETMTPALNLSCTMATCKFDGHTYTSHLSRIAASQPEKFFTRSGSLACSTGLHFQLPPTIGLRNGSTRAV